jgi:hypothetical protein
MPLEPSLQPIDVLARGLARSRRRDRSVFVQLLETLMQVRELPGEEHRGERDRRVAGRPVAFRQRVGGRGQMVMEVGDTVRRGIQRRHERRRRHLRPRGLDGVVVEQDAFGRETLQGRRGLAVVAIHVQMVAAQRVGLDQDDAAWFRVARRGGRRRRAVADDGPAPEAERFRFRGGKRERQAHLPAGEAGEVDRPRFPPVRRRHRVLEHHFTRVALVRVRPRHRDLERDRRLFQRADGEIEPRPLRQRYGEIDGFGRAGGERFAVDLLQALPCHAGLNRGQMFLPEDQPDRLDLERCAGGIGRTQHQMAKLAAGRVKR